MQATKSRRLGAAFTTILLTTMGAQIGGAEVMKVANNIRSICDEAAYAKALATSFKGKLDAALEQAATLHKQSAQWQIAAAVEEESTKRAAKAALSLLLKQRAKQTKTAAITAAPNLKKAAMVLLARATALMTAKDLQPTGAPQKTAAVAATASSAFASSDAKCTISAQQTVETQACDLTKIANSNIETEEPPTTVKHQIKAVSDTYFKPPAITITAFAGGTANSQGNIGTPDATNKDCADGNARGGSRTHGLGEDVAFAATTHSTFSPTAIGTVNNDKLECGTEPDDDATAVPKLQQIKWAICTGLTTDVAKQPQLAATTADELAELADLRQIAQQILFSRTEIEAIAENQRDKQVREKIKDVYGRGKTDFAANYLKALTTKLNYNLGKQNVIEDIKTIVEKPEAEVILAYFEGINYHRKQEESTEKESSGKAANKEKSAKKSDNGDDKKEQDNVVKSACKSFLNQTTCKKGQNCKWENNACKDSSILLTKKFALTVVSAAFAALLF
uniref:Variant surface glycoprotein 1125.4299 n=1 Tax=Trypanosoma brucei TaxID=5691 RepID=A0A1J0RAB4_9TRYP|nr:variant surface glycoprotein 1125.4299 [Trypanosoma brucei]